MTLTEFLLARIAEDEAETHMTDDYVQTGAWGLTRVLAECEAKRDIVALHADGNADTRWEGDPDPLPAYCTTCEDRFHHDAAPWPCPTLRALATVYADHPAFDPEWRL